MSMTDGGKGSKARPFSVDRETFENNWDAIFKNEYQDVLTTEECILNVLEEKKDKE